MDQYCIYLRKSRADAEAEIRGEEETLARHEKTLTALAERMQLKVSQIYREVVSGETIASRPVMQHLLREVEAGLWKGVLVMEVERLARGDTEDQGAMAKTFKYSGTLIITPVKTYNPANEYDEEYFEFGLFMSRREYMAINRRLQRGRVASVMEGKYVGNRPPYGYKRVKLPRQKGFTLEPDESCWHIPPMIFEMYANGTRMEDGTTRETGAVLIAKELNKKGVPTATGGSWTIGTILTMLRNPVYAGWVKFQARPQVKKMENGLVVKTRPHNSDALIAKGLHKPLVSQELFDRVQKKLNKNGKRPEKLPTKNPLAGIIYCELCGRAMQRRPFHNRSHCDTLYCSGPGCKNVGADLDLVESKLLQALKLWLDDYRLSLSNKSKFDQTRLQEKESELCVKEKELQKMQAQLENIHDLLEKGVYSIQTFSDRRQKLTGIMMAKEEEIQVLREDVVLYQSQNEAAARIIPNVKKVLAVYMTLADPEAKNKMLKSILEKVSYFKAKSGRWNGSPDDFQLTIYPRLPRNASH